MNCTIFDDPTDFQARTWSFLLRHEAENNLMIGVIASLAAGNDSFVTPGKRPLLCTVDDRGTLLAATVMTPPFRVILTRAPKPALDLLAQHLHASGVALPGALGPSESAQAFAAAWCRLISRPARRGKSLRIYRLDSVVSVSRAAGSLCEITSADLDLTTEWLRAFCTDCHLDNPPAAERLRQRIDNREFFFWKDPHPVAMASASGSTPNGIRIGAVYTPPALRNRGYASALVAALSQHQLDSGRRFCFLFTDLANPTSNSIYQKIGYRPVCDFEEHDFVPV